MSQKEKTKRSSQVEGNSGGTSGGGSGDGHHHSHSHSSHLGHGSHHSSHHSSRRNSQPQESGSTSTSTTTTTSTSKSTSMSKSTSKGTSMSTSTSKGTSMSTSTSKKLDMQLLVNLLSTCINNDDTINLEYYIKMYKEINRFFELLGAVFHFVSKDVVAKISILEDYQKSNQSKHYVTIESMIQYETEHDLLRKTTEPLSGSRTLLRLHRALEFIIDFLLRANSAKDDDRMCPHAQEAYNNTLANFHPWLIKKAANVAMYTLPYKKDLMEQTCQQKDDVLVALVSEVVTKSKKIYDKVQILYETNNILDLP